MKWFDNSGELTTKASFLYGGIVISTILSLFIATVHFGVF